MPRATGQNRCPAAVSEPEAKTKKGLPSLSLRALTTVEQDRKPRDNGSMPRTEIIPVLPPEIMADLEEVARQAAAGGVRDPQLVRRVTERAEKACEEVFNKFGVQDIGVQIIRELRDSE
jgi:hypothetical protein